MRTNILRSRDVIVVAGMLTLFAACNATSDTMPSSASPTISGTSPSTVFQSAVAQTIQVNGSQFRAGLQLTVSYPNGGVATVAGTDLQSITQSSFAVNLVLLTAGNYFLSVKNNDNLTSSPFLLAVTSQTGPNIPVLNTASPSDLTVSSSLQQVIHVNGQGFDGTIELKISDPSGVITTQPASMLMGLSDSGFDFAAVFPKIGAYSIVVSTATGLSNSLNIQVRQ